MQITGEGSESKHGHAMRAVATVVELVLDADSEADQWAQQLAASLRSCSNEDFLRAVVGRDLVLEYRSAESLIEEPVELPADLHPEEIDGEPTWSLLVRAVHLARRIAGKPSRFATTAC